MSDYPNQLNRDETPLTVGKLREFLALFADDQVVVLSKDGEGNGYSPLATAIEEMYEASSTWSGDTYPTPEMLAAELAQPGSTFDAADDGAPEGAVRVLVLYPTN